MLRHQNPITAGRRGATPGRPAFLFLLACGLLAGCASGTALQPAAGSHTHPTLIANLPFHPQEAYQCGPATLATILNFYGDTLSPDQIADRIFRRKLRATTTVDMLLLPRQRGFTATWHNGDKRTLTTAVDASRPLIVMIDQGWGPVSKNHFMVVAGYTPNAVIVNSGRQRHQRIGWTQFMRSWQKAQFWTLRIEPPNAAP